MSDQAELERLRIKEAKMLEHQRMVEAGEHPSPSEARQPLSVVLPDTGVEVDISTPQGAVQAYHALSELETRLREVKKLCRYALVEESDRRGELSFSVDGRKVSVSSEEIQEKTYDVEKLSAEITLAGLPQERLYDLIRTKAVVDGRVAKQLARNPKYREILERCTVSVNNKPRRVTIT